MKEINVKSSKGALYKSLLAGAVGGLAASYAMNQFQSLWATVAKEMSNGQGDQQQSSGGDDATVKTAELISRSMFQHELTDAEKKWAGPAVHYGFGTLVGAVYGMLAETLPPASSGRGVVFGSAVWLAADEIGVPAMGLSAPPSEAPASSHIKALASHVIYGFTTDMIRRKVKAMSRPGKLAVRLSGPGRPKNLDLPQRF